MKLLQLLDEDPDMTIGERLRNRLSESGDAGVHLSKREALVLSSMLNEHYGSDPFVQEPFLTAEHLKAMGLEAGDLDVAKGRATSTGGDTAPPVEAPPADNVPPEVAQAQGSLDQKPADGVSEEDRKAAALLLGAAAAAGWGSSGESEDPTSGASKPGIFGSLPPAAETQQVAESVMALVNRGRRKRYANEPVQSRDAASIVGG